MIKQEILNKIHSIVEREGDNYISYLVDNQDEISEIEQKLIKLNKEEVVSILKEIRVLDVHCKIFVDYIAFEICSIMDYTGGMYEKICSEKESNVININLDQVVQKAYSLISDEDIKKLKKKLNPEIVQWIETQLSTIDIQDFNVLMGWMNKIRINND